MMHSRSSINRRTFLGAAAATTVGSTLLSACGGGGSSSGGHGSNQISFADWQENNDAIATAVKEFQKTSKVRVQMQAQVPFDDYQTRFRTLLSGSAPPDVVRIDDDDVVQFSVAHELMDLKPDLNSSHFDTKSVVSKLYSYPIQTDGAHTAWVIGVQPRVIYYNKTMFQKEHVPLPPAQWTDTNWKWADFLDAAQKLTIKGGKRWGGLILNDTGFYQTWSVNNNGTGIYSKDGKKFTLADPAGIEAMQWLADLTNKYKVQPAWGSIQQTNAAESLFASGKLGMFMATFGDVPYLRENVKDFEWDVAPIPGQKYQFVEGSLIVFAVPSNAQNQDAAWKLLDFLGSEKAGDIYAGKTAFIPVNTKAGDLIKPTPHQPPTNLRLFIEAAAHQSSVNHTKGTATATQTYRPLMDRVWTGEQTAKSVLTGVRSQVESLLAG